MLLELEDSMVLLASLAVLEHLANLDPLVSLELLEVLVPQDQPDQ